MAQEHSSLNKELINALRGNDTDKIVDLLKKKADPNITKNSITALMCAVSIYNFDAVQALLESRASVNSASPSGMTALMYAFTLEDTPDKAYIIAALCKQPDIQFKIIAPSEHINADMASIINQQTRRMQRMQWAPQEAENSTPPPHIRILVTTPEESPPEASAAAEVSPSPAPSISEGLTTEALEELAQSYVEDEEFAERQAEHLRELERRRTEIEGAGAAESPAESHTLSLSPYPESIGEPRWQSSSVSGAATPELNIVVAQCDVGGLAASDTTPVVNDRDSGDAAASSTERSSHAAGSSEDSPVACQMHSASRGRRPSTSSGSAEDIDTVAQGRRSNSLDSETTWQELYRRVTTNRTP